MQRPARHISTCPTCGAELEETFAGEGGCMFCLLHAGIASEEETVHDSTPDALEGGVRFGVYEIDCHADGSLCELGRGAMGVTYRATDTSLQRKVALKIIKTDIAERSADARERFIREARAAAALRHEHIATVYQFGMRLETGQYFYAMELIEGETLDDRVRRKGPLDARTTIGIGQQVTSALVAAEKHGLVHRDLKPANLMLVNADDRELTGSDQTGSKRSRIRALRKSGIPVVKIIDFGLAKAFHTVTDSKSLTHDRFVGTPAFASPEQFEHSALDVRSDIYSLGETLWFALTGKPPFAGRTLSEIHSAQKSNALPAEQLKAAHVPHGLRSLLESMLAFEPASRPGTGELAARLQRCSPETRKARRTRVALIATAILTLGTSALLLVRPPRIQNEALNPAPEKSIAVLPFENRSDEKANAYFAEGIQDEILTRLSKIADLKVISRTSTQHYKSAPENLPEIAKQLGVAHILEGSVQKSGDAVRVNVQLIKAASDSHLWADTFDRKLTDVFSVESEVAKAIADQLRAKLSGEEQQEIAAKPTNNPEAYDAYLRGLAFFRQGNAPSFRKAANSFAEATQLDPNFAAAWALLARMHSLLYFWNDDVTPARREAAHTALETGLRLQPDLPEVLLAQAYYQYWIVRDYEGARIIFERLRKNFPNSAEIVETLGYIARRQGRWDESRNYIDAAVALNPRYLYLRWQAAGVCEEMRDFSSALQRYDEALNIWPDDANLLAGKATVYQCLGRLDKAEETLQGLHPRAEESRAVRAIYYQAILRRDYPAAIALLRSLVEMDDSPVAMPRNIYRTGLGDLQRLSGDSTAAKASYSQARAELEETLKGQPQNTAIIMTLALIHAGLGEQEAATKYAERTVSLVPISKDALNGSAYEENRARIAARFGDREMAIPILERLLKTPCAEPPITPALLKLDPDFDGLRGDARFQSLCQEKKR